jgi:hypothetical protein
MVRFTYEFRDQPLPSDPDRKGSVLWRFTVANTAVVDSKVVAEFPDSRECLNLQRYLDDGGKIWIDDEMRQLFEAERELAARAISPQAEEQARLDNERRRKERGK